MTPEQKQAWSDYFHLLRQYQLDLIHYYYDLVEWMNFPVQARDGEDDGTGSNPPTPPTPPKPPGS